MPDLLTREDASGIVYFISVLNMDVVFIGIPAVFSGFAVRIFSQETIRKYQWIVPSACRDAILCRITCRCTPSVADEMPLVNVPLNA